MKQDCSLAKIDVGAMLLTPTEKSRARVVVTAFSVLVGRHLLPVLATVVAFVCVLLVTKPAAAQFPQVAGPPYVGPPAFSQKQSPWGDANLGPTRLKMRDWGCAVTALAMMISWYGHPVNPGELNAWLNDRSRNGFEPGGDVRWSVAAGLAPNVSFIQSVNWSGNADLNTVNSDVDEGYLSILRVRVGGRSNGLIHFVLLVGRSGETYYIIDPIDGKRKTLADGGYGNNPRQAIQGIRRYRLNGVGQGDVYAGWHRRMFIDAFCRAGGRHAVHSLVSPVFRRDYAHLQEYHWNGQGQRALVDGGAGVFAVYGAIGATWYGWGNVWSPLRGPRSDEGEAAPSPRGTRGRYQRFENGSIYFSTNWGGHPVFGNISKTYEAHHGTGGRFGFPTGS